MFPSIACDLFTVIRDSKNIERYCTNVDHLSETIAKGANELRGGPSNVRNELSSMISAWKRSVELEILIYSTISVGNGTAGVIASAMGFVPVWGQTFLAAQLFVQHVCTPTAEWRRNIAMHSINTAEKLLEDPECVRGIKLLAEMAQLESNDATIDSILGVVWLLSRQEEHIDGELVKTEMFAPCDAALKRSVARKQDYETIDFQKNIKAFRRELRKLQVFRLRPEDSKNSLKILVANLKSAFGWFLEGIPGFIITCYGRLALAAELVFSLLYLSRHGFAVVFSQLFDMVAVGDTNRALVFCLGRWLSFVLLAVTAATTAVSLALSVLELCSVVETCKRLREMAKAAEQKLQDEASEVEEAIMTAALAARFDAP